MNIGIAGLGRMGAAIGERLVAQGHQLAVWNRSAGKADGLVARGARLAETPAALARVSEVAVKTVRSPVMHARLEALGAVPVGDSPGEFAARIRREWEQSAKIVKIAGVRIE